MLINQESFSIIWIKSPKNFYGIKIRRFSRKIRINVVEIFKFIKNSLLYVRFVVYLYVYTLDKANYEVIILTKKVRLVIAGNEYYVNTDDEGYIRTLACELDSQISAMSRNSPCLSTTMAAVLCALDVSDKSEQLKKEIERLERELRRAVADTASATVEANEAVREIERLSRENMRLRGIAAEK